MSKYKIAVIVTWFGPLPVYFPAWLRSAEMNPDIDFYLFFDSEVKTASKNIHVILTTLEAEIKRAESKLRVGKLSVGSPYKFCDLRPFFGVVYDSYISDYDFWAYCDIDLVFGNIRSFLTDEILEKYDRFYEWGHLSVFRNCPKMNHLFDLPGGVFTKEEALYRSEKVFYEEDFGINRICEKNGISWYKGTEFAEFWVCYSELYLALGRQNFDHQVFYWENGHVYRAGVDENSAVVVTEYIYIHWQKRKPVVGEGAIENGSYYITTNLLEKKEKGAPSAKCIIQRAPGMTEKERKKLKQKLIITKSMEFLKAPWSRKKVWLRQKWMILRERGSLLEQNQ